MEFFKSIFGRKDKPQSKTAPAPETPVQEAPVAAETPVAAEKPAPLQAVLNANTSSSDAIRKALDAATQALVADPSPEVQSIGRQMMELRRQVSDNTCPYKDFDDILVKSIGQVKFFCDTSFGNLAVVNNYVNQLQGAVRARMLTRESVDKYEPTMQTHYYALMMMFIKSRLVKMDMDIDEKNAIIANIEAMPPEKQFTYFQIRANCHRFVSSAMLMRESLEMQLASYDFAHSQAQSAMTFEGEMPEFNPEEVFGVLNEQTAMLEADYEKHIRTTTEMNVKLEEQFERGMLATARAAAARKQQEKQ